MPSVPVLARVDKFNVGISKLILVLGWLQLAEVKKLLL